MQNSENLPVWRTEKDLMDRLITVQNRDTTKDIVTFAAFMETRQALEAYVIQKETNQGNN